MIRSLSCLLFVLSLWALAICAFQCMGVCLYVFLVGATPFEGKNFDEIKRKVISHEIECPFFVSPGLCFLLLFVKSLIKVYYNGTISDNSCLASSKVLIRASGHFSPNSDENVFRGDASAQPDAESNSE